MSLFLIFKNFFYNSIQFENNKSYILFLITSLVIFIIIKLSPSMFPLMLPDSQDYLSINNSNTRTSIYPGLNQLSNYLKIDIVELQVLVLSISLASVILSLTYRTNSFTFFFISLIFLCSNYYYTSFSKTILTESLFFSFINFVIAIVISLKKQTKLTFLILGVLNGLIITIKPIGIIIVIPIILYLIFKNKICLLRQFILLGSSLTIIFLESFLFHSYHEKRSSILPEAMSGKIYMISGYHGFEYNIFPEKFHELIKEIEKKSENVNQFLESINNPLLKIDLTADYEVVFQTQTFNIIKMQDSTLFQEFKNDKNNFYICLKNNILSYISLSFSHYLGQWLTGPKFIFWDDLTKIGEHNIPYYENLILSSSDFDRPSKIILYISLIFFLTLFITFTLISFISILEIFKKRKFDLTALLVITTQLYLVATSLINISTIRYLMPIYPLIILTIIFFIFNKINLIPKSNNFRNSKKD